MQKGAVLEMRGISKFFPGVKALQNVDFTLREGEIHALMGENGAGRARYPSAVPRMPRKTASLRFIRKSLSAPT